MAVLSNKDTQSRHLGMQRLHPVQVEYGYHIGSRIDIESELPPLLDEEDLEEVLDLLSSPPNFIERIAPVSFTVGPETLTGKNPSEAYAKFYRMYQRMLQMVAGVVRQVSRSKFNERGSLAFLGLAFCPETIRRLIEFDYDHADNTYSRLIELVRNGDISPIATVPFHVLLPRMDELEIRFLIRMGLTFYWPLLTYYNRAVRRKLGEDLFTATFWLPEGAFSRKVLETLHTEFTKKCEEEGVGKNHLVLLLETGQAREREHDILMKRWHSIRPTNMTRDYVSIVFREPSFTEWVIQGHPSVKKMLDRTIAKVDASLREAGIDYLWSHFEPIETLLSTYKTALNFQQKLVKLTELGYQPLSPDAFVRRKMLEVYAREDLEPRRCTPLDNTAWDGWNDCRNDLTRWEGVSNGNGIGGKPVVDHNRPYSRRSENGDPVPEPGPQCWKPALHAAFAACHRAVLGETRTFLGGMLQLLRELVPVERIPVQRRNVENFFVRCSLIHWREHFIQTSYSEADIQLMEFAEETLLEGCPDGSEITEEQACIAGLAARAIFFSFEAQRSVAFTPENLDQRGAYEAVAMMTLAMVHAMLALIWSDKRPEADALFEILKRELHDFESAYDRHDLSSLGVDKKDWVRAIKSEVEDSDLNLVARASRRVAARHLRRMGYRDVIPRSDEHISTATGHCWSLEVDQPNMRWENVTFCGLAEE